MSSRARKISAAPQRDFQHGVATAAGSAQARQRPGFAVSPPRTPHRLQRLSPMNHHAAFSTGAMRTAPEAGRNHAAGAPGARMYDSSRLDWADLRAKASSNSGPEYWRS